MLRYLVAEVDNQAEDNQVVEEGNQAVEVGSQVLLGILWEQGHSLNCLSRLQY